jgi:hypothetical protein
MDEDDALKHIPKDWFTRLNREEIDDEIIRVTDNLIIGISAQLGLEEPSKDTAIIKLSEKWNMEVAEVMNQLRFVIGKIVKANLYNKHYGYQEQEDAIKKLKAREKQENEERILIGNPTSYKPEFGIIEVDHIEEIRHEVPDLDYWSFGVFLKDGRIRRFCFEDLKEAEYLYVKLFDMLEKDRHFR